MIFQIVNATKEENITSTPMCTTIHSLNTYTSRVISLTSRTLISTFQIKFSFTAICFGKCLYLSNIHYNCVLYTISNNNSGRNFRRASNFYTYYCYFCSILNNN